LEVTPADPVQPTATYWRNIPDMKIQNDGIELALDYNGNAGGDFSYDIGGNVTYIKNKVKDSPYKVLATGAAQGSGQTGATINGYINDEPIGAFYMFQFDGIGADGLNAFRDINGDGATLDNDRSVVGSAIPKFIYAYHLNFRYKNFDLGLNFNGVAGNKIYNHTAMSLFTKAQLTKSNNTTDFAVRYPNEVISNANTVSTRYLENGSFLRLNNATLGYNLPSNKIGLSNIFQTIRVSVTGQNLFVVTDYSGFDPEINTGSTISGIQTFGIDYFTYPNARTFLISLNVTF
jgi:TonB-dependent starch-binding outer membrane protein SusC